MSFTRLDDPFSGALARSAELFLLDRDAAALTKEHAIATGALALDNTAFWVGCRCGWQARLDLLWLWRETPRRASDLIWDSIKEHLAAVAAQLHPTLSEFAEWGWFDTSAEAEQ